MYRKQAYVLFVIFCPQFTTLCTGVVFTLLVGNEKAATLMEVLRIIKSWNQNWTQWNFMVAFSEAEICALDTISSPPQVRAVTGKDTTGHASVCSVPTHRIWLRWPWGRLQGRFFLQARYGHHETQQQDTCKSSWWSAHQHFLHIRWSSVPTGYFQTCDGYTYRPALRGCRGRQEMPWSFGTTYYFGFCCNVSWHKSECFHINSHFYQLQNVLQCPTLLIWVWSIMVTATVGLTAGNYTGLIPD